MAESTQPAVQFHLDPSDPGANSIMASLAPDTTSTPIAVATPQPEPTPVVPLGSATIAAAPSSSSASTSPIESLVPIVRPTRAASAATPRGKLVEPKLLDVSAPSATPVHDTEWWSKKTPEECLQLLVDPQSGIGMADTKNFTPLQLSRIVDLIEPTHLGVIIRKSNAIKYGMDKTPGVSVAFRDLGYTKNGIKRLQDINGYFRPGTMCAVVGAPDAGISTFFDVLCQRDQGGEVHGDILINGLPRDKSFNRTVAYVMKEDIHLPLLTVRETLTFSAKLRVDSAERDDNAIKFRVDMTLKTLGLRGCSNTIIGNGELRGVSGGERRRVTIGNELVAGTPVVVMDLPTNGLDSATAYDIMNSLKQQSLGGRSFVCSLAQPSTELLRLFDTLLVLSKGAVIYFGPRREVVKYFAALGFFCPEDKPVPEFLEELSAIPHFYYHGKPSDPDAAASLVQDDSKEDDLLVAAAAAGGASSSALTNNNGLHKPVITNPLVSIEDAWKILVDAYKSSITYENVKHEVAREFEPKSNALVETAKDNNYEYNTNVFRQTLLCADRQFTELFRNKAGLQAIVSAQVIIALMLGSLFWRLGTSQADARTRFGLIFFCLTFSTGVASQLIPPYILLRPVYHVQEHGGYYHGAAYYAGRFIQSIPVGIVEVSIFSLIIYSMSGLNGDVVAGARFWYFWLTLFIINLTSKGFSVTIAAISKTEAVGMGIAPVFLLLFMIFSGFMAPYSSMPAGWQWIYWISFVSYSIKGLMVNELMSLTWSCGSSETLLPGVVTTCQLSDGHSALQLYDMDASDEDVKWTMLLYTFFFMIGWNLLACFFVVIIDFSNSDTAEPPNWEAGKKVKKVAEDDVDPALMAALKPEPAFIQWSGLSYIVNLPKQHAIGAAAAKKEAEAKAKMVAEAKQGPSGQQVEMMEVKIAGSPSDDEFQAPDKEGTKTLLTDCYGYAKPGMMVALMGGSGAGKTTLLDVLAGKKTGGEVINGPLINGKPRDSSFNRIAGYVEQFDSHEETQTVKEAITFSAMLRLPAEMSYEMKMNKVETVIQTLRLGHVQDKQIGSVEKGGISPELRKKVTIAVELVMDPGMLFLDEPTTGLDSAGALAVMHAVRKLSDKISVICTIHQPSIEIVNCFTHVLLLNKWRERGRVAYFGPLKGMAPFFSQAGLGEFEDGTNLAEFGLESLRQCERKGMNAAKIFLESPQGQSVTTDIKNGIMTSDGAPRREYTLYAASYLSQSWITTVRTFKSTLRDIPTLGGRLSLSIIISFLVGTLFWQSSFNQLGASNRVALMFMAIAIPAMNAMSKIPVLLSQRLTYFREVNSGMYSPIAYYTGRTLGDQPFIVVETIIYSSILYWSAGCRSDVHGSKFGLFMLCFFLVRSTGLGFVEFFGGLAPTGEAAISTVGSWFTMFQLFTGFLIRKSAIPRGWIWMHYLSLFKYPVAFLVSQELSGLTFSCPNNDGAISLPFGSDVDIASIVSSSNGAVYCTGFNNTLPCYACPITDGDAMLDVFDMPTSYSERALMLGCCAIWMVGYRFLAYLSLRYKNHIQK